MEAYRVGEHRAPQGFIERLRSQVVTGGNLDCWWVDSAARYVRLPDGTKTREKGCWVIWEMMKGVQQSEAAGVEVMVSAEKWVDIYHIDGEWGLPTELGPWVFDALNHSNPLSRGNGLRMKAVNDMDSEAVMHEYDKSHKIAEGMAKDKFIQRIMKQAHDQIGTPTKTKEDVKQEIAHLEREEGEWREQAKNDAEDLRVYPEIEV